MKMISKVLSKILIDPNDQSELTITWSKNGNVKKISKKNGKCYSVTDGVIDFVGDNNYAKNFGDQWTRFPKLQLDSFNGTNISEDRFLGASGFVPKDLIGKIVLDVGCGTGRFAEIALKYGAIVVGLDYSVAARVASQNLKEYENFIAIQGNIFNLPFKPKSFDLVYCLGVLQHTPDVEKSFKMLVPMVKNSGDLVVDYYWKRFRTIIGWKYVIRLITSRLDEKSVLTILKIVHPILYPLADMLARIPKLGKMLSRLIPVVNYRLDYTHISDDLLKEWSFLDTYDMLAPKYDKPQTIKTITKWAKDANVKNIKVEQVGHLVLRGKIPSS